MNHRQLRYFCEVAEVGTLARAAERLHVAPTALSMQIADLEKSIGGALFDRSVKPMALNALGRFFLPRARELLAQHARLEQDILDLASGHQGWLGIGFVRSLLYSVLPLAVRAFRKENPEVKLELVELLSEHQPEALRAQRIHIGLSRHHERLEAPAGLAQHLLFNDPYVAAVPAKHPLARGGATTLAALLTLPMISFPKDPASAYAGNVRAILAKANVMPRVGHEAIEIHTALSLVAAGLGFAIVGGSVATRGPADVRYVRLPELDVDTEVLALTRSDDSGPLVQSMLTTLARIGHRLEVKPGEPGRRTPTTATRASRRSP